MDANAYETAVLQLKDRVYSYATWMLQDPEESKDVSQDALIRLWQHRLKVAPEAAKSWLLTTTHRLCVDRLRLRGRVAALPDRPAAFHEAAPDPGPERLANADETARAIGRALGQLGPQDRAVVVLREIQGMTYREIGQSLGIPLGTLKARLHRARERLRDRLTGAGVTP